MGNAALEQLLNRPTPKYLMLRDATGCPDGFILASYRKDGEYELPAQLAQHFIKIGAAKCLI